MNGKLYEFFNSRDVSHINVFIALMRDYPEWLRGIHNEFDLPRRVNSFQLEHKLIAPNNVGKLAIALDWIVMNTTGAWNFTHTWIFFEKEEDAFLYTMALVNKD